MDPRVKHEDDSSLFFIKFIVYLTISKITQNKLIIKKR